MRAVLICLLIWAAPSYAGYYLQLQSSGQVDNWPGVGWTSTGCFLTPSMSVNGILGFYNLTVTGFTASTMSVWAYSSWKSPSTSYLYVFAIKECSVSPTAGPLPVFANGVSDPAISSGSILSASGSGSNTSSTPQEINVSVDPAVIQPVDPDRAVSDSMSLFGLGLVLLSSIWGLKRLYYLFTESSSQ